jgi:site-specific DNA recombinase
MSPRNAGLIENRGEVVGPATWPAIISEDIYRGVVAVLSNPVRRYGKTRGRKRLLSGIAVCGSCDATLGSGITTSTGQPNYVCKHCFKVSRNLAKVDAVVIEAVVDRLSRDDAEDLIADDRPDATELAERREALRAQQRAAAADAATGKISYAFATTMDQSLTEQINALTAQLTNASKVDILGDVIGPDADQKFDALNLDRQRTIVSSLMTVTVNPTGKGKPFDRHSVDVVFR